jgi:membrane protein implicated in regulation of membrane protease activity
MDLGDVGGMAGAWLIAALALGIAELLIPGVFLIFLAIAAAITGIATLALAELPVAGQVVSFTIWSVVTVMIGRRWYTDYPVATTDALLNDRGGRMIGQIVIVDAEIIAGAGRVRIGDGSWPAQGPDMPAGQSVKIVGLVNGVVAVERIDQTAA